MITLLNVWHYVAFVLIFLFFILGIVVAYIQKDKKQRGSIIITFSVIAVFVFVLSFYGVDSYTKSARVYKVEHKRILNTEEIMFSGIVENNGDYEIGEVEVEIKISNNGKIMEGWKGGASFFSSMDFFGLTKNGDSKPQQVSKKFIVTKNLKPGYAEQFNVYLDYPPYFDGMSYFITVTPH